MAQSIHPQDIEGWGADLDPNMRPAVPKERTPPRLDVPWDQPEQQAQTVPVLISIERPGLTPVFGTSAPPQGISGAIRRVAFKYSEGDTRHWLILFAADRVNVAEGLVDDLLHGKVPNVFAEMGWRAEFKHRPARAAVKAGAVAAAVGFVLYRLLKPRTRKVAVVRRLMRS